MGVEPDDEGPSTMPKPVHAQPAAVLTERRREITKRAADLCRAQPAVFAGVVRHADRLRAQDLSDDDALEQALDSLGAT